MTQAKQLINSIPDTFKKDLEFISNEIQKKGKESFVIGGSVRDLILGKYPDEYDLTTSMQPDEVKKLFKRVIETGIKHGTVTVLIGDRSYEITTYRRDMDYTDGRRPDRIEFGESLSEDMKRRDFTMNAIALDLINERLIDEHNGLEDIQRKIIRTIGDPLKRFGEDGLRPIRAIRFLSTLGFTIEEETYLAILKTRNITEKISKERFHDELNKILISKNPSIGLIELQKNKIFELFTKAKINHQNSADIEIIGKLELTPLGLRLAFMLDWLLETNEKKENAEQFLRDIRYSRANLNDCLFYLELFKENPTLENGSDWENRRFAAKVVSYTGNRSFDSYFHGIMSFLKLFNSETSVFKFQKEIESILHSTVPLSIKDLAVNGNQIIERFPNLDKRKIGLILKHALEKTIELPDLNQTEKLFDLIETYLIEL